MFGVIGAVVAYIITSGSTQESTPGMPVHLIPVMASAVGFVVGAVVGCVVMFLLDLLTRKKEQELDDF